MKAVCPNCAKETEVRLIKTIEEIPIRGELIPTPVEYYQCEECGQDFEIPRPDYDPLDSAYREYRHRKGMLQPEEIKEFRKRMDLTQREFSQILEIGLATLNRYENGALQSEAHDQHIRLSMQPKNFEHLLETKPGLLSDINLERILHVLQNPEKDCSHLLSTAVDTFGSYAPSILSGYQKFNIDKLIQVIKFFCLKVGVVKTKLNKLLFYADFKYFKDHAVSITGARYAHATLGPVPDQFDTWFAALVDWRNEITVEEKTFGDFTGEEYISRDVDLSIFSPSEIVVLAQVKEKFDSYNAARIVDYSHREKGYLDTTNGALISYQYATELSI